jgi:hypothetical protein
MYARVLGVIGFQIPEAVLGIYEGAGRCLRPLGLDTRLNCALSCFLALGENFWVTGARSGNREGPVLRPGHIQTRVALEHMPLLGDDVWPTCPGMVFGSERHMGHQHGVSGKLQQLTFFSIRGPRYA